MASPDCKPVVWKAGPAALRPEDLSQAASLLVRGGLVVYPTETFYALGAVPALASAVEKVFAAKGREAGKPLPLIASSLADVFGAVSGWTDGAKALAEAFWPGPLTLVLPAAPSLPSILHAGTGKIAVRVSPHPAAALLAKLSGGLLVSTSANRSGAAPPRELREISPELLCAVDGLVDAGSLPGGLPSTIVDVSSLPPRLVRKGKIGWDAIENILAVS